MYGKEPRYNEHIFPVPYTSLYQHIRLFVGLDWSQTVSVAFQVDVECLSQTFSREMRFLKLLILKADNVTE